VLLLLLLCCVRLDAAELRLDAPVKVCRAEAFQSEVRKIVIHDVFDDHFAVDFPRQQPAGAMIDIQGQSALFSLLRVLRRKSARRARLSLSLSISSVPRARALPLAASPHKKQKKKSKRDVRRRQRRRTVQPRPVSVFISSVVPLRY
jgi:hypothetical protein